MTDVVTKIKGREIVWNGHLCEGADLNPQGGDFCLWTRCGNHDVPANSAHLGARDEVTCAECLAKEPAP